MVAGIPLQQHKCLDNRPGNLGSDRVGIGGKLRRRQRNEVGEQENSQKRCENLPFAVHGITYAIAYLVKHASICRNKNGVFAPY